MADIIAVGCVSNRLSSADAHGRRMIVAFAEDVGFDHLGFCCITSDERFERWSPEGTATEIADFLAPYADAGCTLCNLIMNGRSAEHEIEAASTIRDRVARTAGRP